MYGVIFGDIAGKPYEGYGRMEESQVFRNKDVNGNEIPDEESSFTDDTVLSIAIAECLLHCKAVSKLNDMAYVGTMTHNYLQKWGNQYPTLGYGTGFLNWLDEPVPYDSCGNGAAMRVSAAGMIATSKEQARKLGEAVTKVTHNHPEGIKGGVCTAVLTYMAGMGTSKEEILYEAEKYYDMNFHFYERKEEPMSRDIWLCQGAVPLAIKAFLESESYEDMIRKLIAFGGDTDTTAAIAGSFGGLYYKVPEHYVKYVNKILLKDSNPNCPIPPILEAFLLDEDVYPKISRNGKLADKPLDYVPREIYEEKMKGKIAIPVIAKLKNTEEDVRKAKNVFHKFFQKKEE